MVLNSVEPGSPPLRVVTELIGETLRSSHVADVRGRTVDIGLGVERPGFPLRGNDDLGNIARNLLPLTSQEKVLNPIDTDGDEAGGILSRIWVSENHDLNHLVHECEVSRIRVQCINISVVVGSHEFRVTSFIFVNFSRHSWFRIGVLLDLGVQSWLG